MLFDLNETPFRDIHTHSFEELLDYLDFPLRQLVLSHRDKHRTALPPCSFVFSTTKVSYLAGYSCSTPEEFTTKVKMTAQDLEANLVLLITEIGSVSSPGSVAFLAVEVQRSGQETIRCAYDLLGPSHSLVDEDWTFRVHTNSVSPMMEESSHILGLSSFFCPIFDKST